MLGKEKPFASISYLKEDTKQKDAAARQVKVEEGKDPKLSRSDKGGKAEKKKVRPRPMEIPPSWTRTSTTSWTPRCRTR